MPATEPNGLKGSVVLRYGTFAKVGEGQGVTFMADGLDRRIHYVMEAGPIAKLVIESRPLLQGAFRLNDDDPESFALSDHLPKLAVIEG